MNNLVLSPNYDRYDLPKIRLQVAEKMSTLIIHHLEAIASFFTWVTASNFHLNKDYEYLWYGQTLPR